MFAPAGAAMGLLAGGGQDARPGAASLVLLGAFFVRQKTVRHPLMPLRILSSRAVTGANLVQVLGAAGMFGMFFLGSLYLRRILALIAHGRPVAVALTDGYHLAFWIAFGLVIAAIAVAATVLRPQRPATAPSPDEDDQDPLGAGAGL